MTDQPVVKKCDAQLEVPSDPLVLQSALKNIYAALNTANKSGIYDLQESYKLRVDIEVIGQLIAQINKTAYGQVSNVAMHQ